MNCWHRTHRLAHFPMSSPLTLAVAIHCDFEVERFDAPLSVKQVLGLPGKMVGFWLPCFITVVLATYRTFRYCGYVTMYLHPENELR